MVAGIGLGHSFLQIIGAMPIMGILLTMDTLISQSKGAGNLELCGVILNRSRFIILIMYIPPYILSFHVKSIYVFMGLDPISSNFA